MEIVVANDQHREDLFAEIHAGGQPWAEVIYDGGKEEYVVTLFPPGADEEWPVFGFVELVRALHAARDALVARGYPDPNG